MGSNSIEAALIDMVTEHVRDIKQAYNDAKAGKTGDDQKAAKTEFITNLEKLPSWFAKLENTLSGNGFGIFLIFICHTIIIINYFHSYWKCIISS